MTTVRKRYPGLDIAKFVCSLVILFYHFFSEHGPIPSLFEDMLSLYAVCVALFMVISGFLLYDKVLSTEDIVERRGTVKKQVLRILQVYAIWSIPYLIYSVSRWDFSNISLEFVLWKVQGLIFNSTFFTIWFMPSLAIGIVISFVVVEKLPTWVVCILALFSYLLGSLNSTYSFLISGYPWFEGVNRFISTWLNGSRGQFLYGFPLVTLGYFIANHKNRFKPIPAGILSILFLGCLLAEALTLRHFVGHTGVDTALMLIPVCTVIIGFLISIPLPWFELCSWMRKMSVLIFMSQRLFLTVLPNISIYIKELYQSQFISFIIICGGTILFSQLIITLSDRVKWLKKLY